MRRHDRHLPPVVPVDLTDVAAVRILLLVGASASALAPWRRIPAWLPPAVIGLVVAGSGLVPWRTTTGAVGDLAPAIAFLLLAVPVALLLDRAGFFAAVAARFDAGRGLVPALWVLAAATTIVCNLDAAVVLLTPLYVRIAVRRDLDPVMVGAIPAVLASLASSVLPVSNLTNLIAAERLGLDAADFLRHLLVPSIVAITVGGVLHHRLVARHPSGVIVDEPVDRRALSIGAPVVVFLLLGFTVGDRMGIPAWSVAGAALVVLIAATRTVPWRDVPVGAAALAGGLGVVAAGAAPHLPIDRLLAIDGPAGAAATVGVFALGANSVNNLPALLVSLPALDGRPDRVWDVLLGVNLGPTLWVTGALSTLLWQATMHRLGHPVSAIGYARIAAVVGGPALVAATLTRVLALAA